ncbi:phosphoglycerate mutase [Psychrobacter urativorans]|uniref:Phosphoglycerate mutase n=2 Tax=Psychrobacter urativorans TaxID=45610 RepID=A0A0M3V9L6_9GAMM|nr:phosphoglycerate mutase [Psychrobacter urativorans]
MTLYIWRHPQPVAAKGICLGHTDMSVDRRKLKRLANQIQHFARLHHLPKVIWVSPLQRSLKVGQLLAKRGFQCHISPDLTELNFGAWDGRPWVRITKEEIDEWCANFAHFAPENGESLQQLFHRIEDWLNARMLEQSAISTSIDMSVLAVGHAGWINAAKMITAGKDVPQLAIEWSAPVVYNQLSILKYAKKV